MSEDRLAAAEEWVMRLRMDQEQLDRAVQVQGRMIAELQQRVARLEQQLERLGADEGDEKQ